MRWTCEALAKLTPKQWQDAFRASGYDEATGDRFIRRMQQKVQQGLAAP